MNLFSSFLSIKSILLVVLMIMGEIETHFSKKGMLTAVTRFKGLQQFYLQIRQRNEHFNEYASIGHKERPEIRIQICEQIFQSHYFKMNMKETLDMNDKRTIKRLRKNYPLIFENIYQRSASTLNVLSISVFDANLSYNQHISHYEYVNSYREREVSVGADEISYEHVFSCPVKDRRTEVIREYFVSREYILDKVDEDYFVVRFMFSSTVSKDLIVHAMVEEAAVRFNSTIVNVEDQYTFRREFQKPAPSAAEDDLCKLSKSEKYRLCAIVMGSDNLKNQIYYWPSAYDVDYRCHKKTVSLQIDGVRKDNDKNIYEEWVIKCKAVTMEEKTRVAFFISRAYEPRKVFVYKSLAGKLVLDHECNSIHFFK